MITSIDQSDDKAKLVVFVFFYCVCFYAAIVLAYQMLMILSDLISNSNLLAGEEESVTTKLLKSHDAFEKTAHPIYAVASQLFTKATHLANSGQCNPDLVERESSALEGVVNTFASQLDGRREIILQAKEVYTRM